MKPYRNYQNQDRTGDSHRRTLLTDRGHAHFASFPHVLFLLRALCPSVVFLLQSLSSLSAVASSPLFFVHGLDIFEESKPVILLLSLSLSLSNFSTERIEGLHSTR